MKTRIIEVSRTNVTRIVLVRRWDGLYILSRYWLNQNTVIRLKQWQGTKLRNVVKNYRQNMKQWGYAPC